MFGHLKRFVAGPGALFESPVDRSSVSSRAILTPLSRDEAPRLTSAHRENKKTLWSHTQLSNTADLFLAHGHAGYALRPCTIVRREDDVPRESDSGEEDRLQPERQHAKGEADRGRPEEPESAQRVRILGTDVLSRLGHAPAAHLGTEVRWSSNSGKNERRGRGRTRALVR